MLLENVWAAPNGPADEPIHFSFNGISMYLTEIDAARVAWTLQKSIAALREDYHKKLVPEKGLEPL